MAAASPASHLASIDSAFLTSHCTHKNFNDRQFDVGSVKNLALTSKEKNQYSSPAQATAYHNSMQQKTNSRGASFQRPLGRVAQWKSSCAVVKSQVATQTDQRDYLQLPGLENLEDSALTGFPTLHNMITIADLAPAPNHEALIRVAYRGVPGAYSEVAVARAYPSCEAVPCDQFEVTFQAVESWLADRAVLPVEDSLGGSIHRNYDLLLRHRLHIVGEIQLPVHHCLLALPGVKKEEVRRVISHPQALAHCEQTLTKMGINVAREGVDDTAGAAQFIAATGLRDTAAIASSRAAENYGMEILADGIQDARNMTRFVMLAREPIVSRTDRPFKTSIVFALEDEPGALSKVLDSLSFRGINATKMESRPLKGRPLRVVHSGEKGTAKYFEYLFYLDFEASMADARAQKAVRCMQEHTTFFSILGSYPMDMSPL